ncbi:MULTISPECIES: AlpA family transcriptional regulator [unclassified Nocardia]|uniref:helix-turn-helix transcriptional regulator n=1 Tax=unclassified Nocardia TaxID=2637762 RepID=UPI001CE417C8|nr:MULTISPECIES: hypothetical protein [unclassified Nocardia]
MEHPDRWPLTRVELARRYGVSPSTVTRALARADARHQADPTQPAPPAPVNPGEPTLRYLPAEFDAWWAARPPVGRPPLATPALDE